MLPAPEPTVVVVNESKHIDPTRFFNIVWTLGYQVRWQFAPLWKAMAHVVGQDVSAPVPVDAWILHLLDTPDIEGALGYHDEDGKHVPYGKVFCELALDNGIDPCAVASHELLEMLGDPHVNLSAYDPGSERLYAFEVSDPVQGNDYDLGDPYRRKTGMRVSDFVLPSYFDPNTGNAEHTSYRNSIKGPFTLAAEGYVSYTTELPPNWEQQLGEKVKQPVVDADDRVSRRSVVA